METSDLEVIEDGSTRDSRGRRIMPKAERERLARESFTCGLSVRAFARSQGVNYHTLISWREVFRKEHPQQVADLALGTQAGGADSSAMRFLEYNLPSAQDSSPRSSAYPLEVSLPDGTVLRGSKAEQLGELARALRC